MMKVHAPRLRSLRPRDALVASLIGLVASACASHYTPEQLSDVLSRALVTAERRHAQGMEAEAAMIANAIAGLDATYPGLEELQSDIDPAIRARMHRGPLGMNRKLRPAIERPLWMRSLLFVPDRLLDLLDVVTVGVHFGNGAFADAHLTHAMQWGGGLRSTGGLGWHDYRCLGLKVQAETGVNAVALGAESYVGTLFGTSGVRGAAGSIVGLHRPSDRIYQELRDYWAMGASATAGIVGAEADLHVIQLADFLAGFVGIDFLNDDFARTRSLELDADVPVLLSELWKVERSRSSLQAYHDWKARAQASSAESGPGESSPPAAPERGEPTP